MTLYYVWYMIEGSLRLGHQTPIVGNPCILGVDVNVVVANFLESGIDWEGDHWNRVRVESFFGVGETVLFNREAREKI